MKNKTNLGILVLAALGATNLQAAVSFTSFSSDDAVAGDSAATSPSGADLFQTTSLTSTNFPVNTNIANGSTGIRSEESTNNPANVVFPSTFDFILNIDANPLGYDISSIATYTGWNDNRAGQNYTVSFSLVGSEDFTEVLVVNQAANATSLVTTITDDAGALLGTGVDVIRFDIGISGAENVYREIDAFGVATVPEPSVSLLAGLAGMALLRRRRR